MGAVVTNGLARHHRVTESTEEAQRISNQATTDIPVLFLVLDNIS